MEITFTHDVNTFDFEAIHTWLASTYWSPGIAREKVEKGFKASTVCVGAFEGATQVGAGRCMSDTTRFGYIADIYVHESQRGKGIARLMVKHLMEHPLVRDVDSWYLLTRDAQAVYAGLGFEVFPRPDNFMIKRKV